MALSLGQLASAGVVDLSGVYHLMVQVQQVPENDMFSLLLQSGSCSVDCQVLAAWLRSDLDVPPQAAAAAAQGLAVFEEELTTTMPPVIVNKDGEGMMYSDEVPQQFPAANADTDTGTAAQDNAEETSKKTCIHEELATWSWAAQETFRSKLKRLTRMEGAGQWTLQELDDTLQGLADQLQVWRNIRYGKKGDRHLPVYPHPFDDSDSDAKPKPEPVDQILFGARLRVLKEVDVQETEAKWLQLAVDRASGQGEHWVLARSKDVVQCLPLHSECSRGGRTAEEAFKGQIFPEAGMYTEGYGGGCEVCLISASGDALWREVNIEMLAHDIATSTVFEQQWGGDENFTDWVAYYATNVVMHGQLYTDHPKQLFVTVKHTKNWQAYVGEGQVGPAVEDVKEDIGKAQYKECEWLCGMQKRLNLVWSEVRFVTAFTFLCKHCGWTLEDCQEVALAKLKDFLAAPKQDYFSDRHAAESHNWRCAEALKGVAEPAAWPDDVSEEPLVNLQVKALKINKALTMLSPCKNNIEQRLTEALLSTTSALTTLHCECFRFAMHKIGHEELRVIAEGLKTNSAITSVNLKYARIGDEGAKSIAEARGVPTRC